MKITIQVSEAPELTAAFMEINGCNEVTAAFILENITYKGKLIGDILENYISFSKGLESPKKDSKIIRMPEEEMLMALTGCDGDKCFKALSSVGFNIQEALELLRDWGLYKEEGK